MVLAVAYPPLFLQHESHASRRARSLGIETVPRDLNAVSLSLQGLFPARNLLLFKACRNTWPAQRFVVMFGIPCQPVRLLQWKLRALP